MDVEEEEALHDMSGRSSSLSGSAGLKVALSGLDILAVFDNE